MEIRDNATQGIKPYRDHTSTVLEDKKATQQGIMIMAQDDRTADYTVLQGGDEAGWLYTAPRTTAQRHDMGSWSQAVPAILRDSDSYIVPMLDKTQAVDTNYIAKTQSTSAGDYADQVRVAETDGTGTPGIVLTCLNDTSQEQIFFSMSDNKIKVDNITAPNSSTKIYDVKADGTVDLTNVGTTKDLLFVESNQACIKTSAVFRESTLKKGPIDFETSAYPIITTPGTPANYEVKTVFNSVTNKWKSYCIAESSANATLYARIRWDFSIEQDLSEGEILNYDSTLDYFNTTSVAIWIDWQRSRQCQFSFCGNTCFVVKLLKAGVARMNHGVSDTRDLYYAVQNIGNTDSYSQLEYKVTHFQTPSEINLIDDTLQVIPSTTETAPIPWNASSDAAIKTRILGVEQNNYMYIKIPSEWRPLSGTNYTWTEVHDLSRGLPFWGRPIRPKHQTDYENHYYESAEQVAGVPIGIYARVN